LSLSLFVTFSLPLFLSFSLSLSKYMFISCLLALCATFPHSHSTPPLPNTQTYIHTYICTYAHARSGRRSDWCLHHPRPDGDRLSVCRRRGPPSSLIYDCHGLVRLYAPVITPCVLLC
jgi:hypothetical protein